MKKRGFTLIELVAVLAIISLITTVGLIKFNTVDRVRANNEVQTLINDIEYAKMKAMAQGNSYEMRFGENFYKLSRVESFDRIELFRRDLDYINFTDFGTSNNKNYMIFNRAGTVTNPGTITMIIDKNVDSDLVLELRVKVGDANARIKEKD